MIEKLSENELFKGFTREEVIKAANLFEANEINFKKKEIVFREGEMPDKIGIITDGNIIAMRSDIEGHTYIVANKIKNTIIGETCVISEKPFVVDLVASEPSSIVFLKIKNLIEDTTDLLGWKTKFVSNLLIAVSNENDAFASRIIHISPRTIRGRVISFFRSHFDQYGNDEFDISLNRQQMADYLNVDRSALSNELGKMRKEGLIDFHRGHFKLLKPFHLIED